MISILSFICISVCVNARNLLSDFAHLPLPGLKPGEARALWTKIDSLPYEAGDFRLDLYDINVSEKEMRALFDPESLFWQFIEEKVSNHDLKRTNICASHTDTIIIHKIWLEFYNSVGRHRGSDGEMVDDEWFRNARAYHARGRSGKWLWIKKIPPPHYGVHTGRISHCDFCSDIITKADGSHESSVRYRQQQEEALKAAAAVPQETLVSSEEGSPLTMAGLSDLIFEEE